MLEKLKVECLFCSTTFNYIYIKKGGCIKKFACLRVTPDHKEIDSCKFFTVREEGASTVPNAHNCYCALHERNK